jgi:hypothetical protein
MILQPVGTESAMTRTTTAADRAAISRRNGQKSKGPKTPEGKNRSKFNALKHGLDAKTPVLPGEDAAAYQRRIDAWTADLQPRNPFEHFLIQQAARVSWQIQRADRAETARLTNIIRNAAADEAQRLDDEMAELGRRLFRDPLGPLALYPHAAYQPGQPRISVSPTADDADHPSRLIPRLEATAAGCRWLLDQWAELRAILDQGLGWQSPDKLKAIRLLGKQPLDAADVPEVATIFLASYVLAPHHGDPFAELWHELLDSEVIFYKQRLAGRRLESLQPRDQPEARRALTGIVDRATSRLATMAQIHLEREAAAAAQQADRLAFDDSDQGERLRRLQMYCGRSFLRMLDLLLKIRPPGEVHSAVPSAARGKGSLDKREVFVSPSSRLNRNVRTPTLLATGAKCEGREAGSRRQYDPLRRHNQSDRPIRHGFRQRGRGSGGSARSRHAATPRVPCRGPGK